MMLTPQRVQHIFEGCPWKSRLEAPNYTLTEAEIIAEEIIDASGRPTDWPNPLGLALGLKYRPIPGRFSCGTREVCDRVRIFYRPSSDPREQGCQILHGVTHNWCAERHPDANEGAIWLVTGGLVVLYRHRMLSLDQVISRQRHAPVWLIAARMMLLDEHGERRITGLFHQLSPTCLDDR